MLYEIGKPRDITAFSRQLSGGINKLLLVGNVIENAVLADEKTGRYCIKLRLCDGKEFAVYLKAEDIPHTEYVMVEGELWNVYKRQKMQKGIGVLQNAVEVYAHNVVELEDVSEVNEKDRNRVCVTGRVCRIPVYLPSEEEYEIVLLTYTDEGEAVKMVCRVPRVAEDGTEKYPKGSLHELSGQLTTRRRRVRCGRQYIEAEAYNYIRAV